MTVKEKELKVIAGKMAKSDQVGLLIINAYADGLLAGRQMNENKERQEDFELNVKEVMKSM